MDGSQHMSTSYSSSLENLNASEGSLNGTAVNQTSEGFTEEVARMIIITTFPSIIIVGTIGNLLTFFVMRRGTLKHSSTCFYMAILALADTGKGDFTIDINLFMLLNKTKSVKLLYKQNKYTWNYFQLSKHITKISKRWTFFETTACNL